jgi:hypothetical protein
MLTQAFLPLTSLFVVILSGAKDLSAPLKI